MSPRRSHFLKVSPALVLAALAGCRPHTRVVPEGPHPKGAPTFRVETPPPDARVEIVPLARRRGCAWLDGHYERRGRVWQWQKGLWVRPPPGCFYARSRTRYEETDEGVQLIHRPGAWYPSKSEKACEVVLPCEADARPNRTDARDDDDSGAAAKDGTL
jgi:hypothetical protein